MRRAGWLWGDTTQLPLLWPWVDSQTCCHMWVEFFFGSYPCSEVYSPSLLGFFPPEILTFHIPIQPGNSGQEELPRGMSTAKCPLFPLYSHIIYNEWQYSFLLYGTVAGISS